MNKENAQILEVMHIVLRNAMLKVIDLFNEKFKDYTKNLLFYTIPIFILLTSDL